MSKFCNSLICPKKKPKPKQQPNFLHVFLKLCCRVDLLLGFQLQNKWWIIPSWAPNSGHSVHLLIIQWSAKVCALVVSVCKPYSFNLCFVYKNRVPEFIYWCFLVESCSLKQPQKQEQILTPSKTVSIKYIYLFILFNVHIKSYLRQEIINFFLIWRKG